MLRPPRPRPPLRATGDGGGGCAAVERIAPPPAWVDDNNVAAVAGAKSRISRSHSFRAIACLPAPTRGSAAKRWRGTGEGNGAGRGSSAKTSALSTPSAGRWGRAEADVLLGSLRE